MEDLTDKGGGWDFKTGWGGEGGGVNWREWHCNVIGGLEEV